MASSLPFNDILQVFEMPDFEDLKESLRQHGLNVPFTVINPRGGSRHTMEVQVICIAKLRHLAGNDRPTWRIGEFSVDGDIIMIDHQPWYPPANQFYARYVDANPAASGFKILNHV